MSDTIHHQADPPGVTWDLTIDGHRYVVIEDGPSPTDDCGYPGSREYAYQLGCRCGACRTERSAAEQRRRVARVARPRGRPPGGQTRRAYRCGTCDETFTAWATAQRHADSHGGAHIEVEL